MNIAIIMPGLLPVPAVKGGAVESLIEHIIVENEKRGQHNFTVYNCFDETACQRQTDFRYTRFYNVRRNTALDGFCSFFARGVRKAFGVRICEDYAYLLKIVSAVKRGGHDVVVIQNVPSYAPALKRARIGPIVLHMHNCFVNASNGFNADCAAACDALFTVSEYMKRDMLTARQLEGKRITTLPNCTDIDEFNGARFEAREKLELRARYGISPEAMLYLYTGRLIPEKGVLELIQAFKRLPDPAARLLIVGGADFSKPVEGQYCQQLKREADERVIFAGYIPHLELPLYYACADTTVLPSTCAEAAGLTAIEAMATGSPLIITNSGGMAEYGHAGGARVVPLDEMLVQNLACAMGEYAQCEKLRADSAQSGRRAVLGLNVEAYYKKFIDAVESIRRA